MATQLNDAVRTALTQVNDPEIRRPITDLGMVAEVVVTEGTAAITIALTTAGCPLKQTLERDITAAATTVAGVDAVQLTWTVMTTEQRSVLMSSLRGPRAERTHPFTDPTSPTRVYAIASGKGGVGKSSVTANLASALACQGANVGVIDADIYGFSIPGMLGVTGKPTKVDPYIMPPSAHDIRVISMGMFVPDSRPVVWRGPMLHRAVEQFLCDVYWGELDYLLVDMPPGTGDVAISIGQLLPNADILVVTTPQAAASEPAERAGSLAQQTKQRIAGVIENMSYLSMPDGSRLEVFGAGGGQRVADSLSTLTGTTVPLLGQVPLDPELRADADAGTPVVIAHPQAPAAQSLTQIATRLASNRPSIVGRDLGLTPVT